MHTSQPNVLHNQATIPQKPLRTECCRLTSTKTQLRGYVCEFLAWRQAQGGSHFGTSDVEVKRNMWTSSEFEGQRAVWAELEAANCLMIYMCLGRPFQHTFHAITRGAGVLRGFCYPAQSRAPISWLPHLKPSLFRPRLGVWVFLQVSTLTTDVS